jgi:hypothetical protein
MSLNKQTWHISFCRVVRETRDKYIGGIQQQRHSANPEILHHTQEKEIGRKKGYLDVLKGPSSQIRIGVVGRALTV